VYTPNSSAFSSARWMGRFLTHMQIAGLAASRLPCWPRAGPPIEAGVGSSGQPLQNFRDKCTAPSVCPCSGPV
jgi:hypothetical protein